MQGFPGPDRLFVAQVGGPVDPHERLQFVLFHAFAFVIQDTEVVLGGGVILQVYTTLAELGKEVPPVAEKPQPAVPIRKSITRDYII